MSQWQLWKRETTAVSSNGGKKFVFQTDYAWINPDGVITEHRPSNPYGCVPFRNVWEKESDFWLFDLRGESLLFLKQFEGWKKVKTKMTDEQLAKGWLLPG